MARLDQVTSGDVGEFVRTVETRLRELLAEGDDHAPEGRRVLTAATRHLTLAPAAKRARPQLVHHFGTLLDVSSDSRCAIAIAAELVHTASLLHDDVIDEGTERRDRPTVNRKWDNISAVLSGDALLCAALKRLQRFTPAVTALAVDVVDEMTESIMHEVRSRHRIDLAPRDWEVIAGGKTGSLFGFCGAAPALVADRRGDADRLEACGRHLGLAFQLADDLKDVLSQESGKDRYADIRNGNPSYPLIRAVDDDPSVGEDLEAFWDGHDDAPSIAELGTAIAATDALEATRRRIRREVDNALEALGTDSDRPGGRQIAGWANTLCETI